MFVATVIILLAVSEDARFAVSLLSLVISVLLAVATTYIGIRQRRGEKRDERLEQKAEDLVDAKIANKTGELAGAIKELTTSVRNLERRLDDGDDEFKHVGERSQKIELALANQTKDLQKWMLETFATKQEHQHLETKIGGLADRMVGAQLEAARAGAVAAAAGGGGGGKKVGS